MKEWKFHPFFDLQPSVHRPVFAPDLSKPCLLSNHVQTTFIAACQDRVAKAPDLSKPCPTFNHVHTAHCTALPTWIYLPVKTNFVVYQVNWVQDGKIKISRSDKPCPTLSNTTMWDLYLFLLSQTGQAYGSSKSQLQI